MADPKGNPSVDTVRAGTSASEGAYRVHDVVRRDGDWTIFEATHHETTTEGSPEGFEMIGGFSAEAAFAEEELDPLLNHVQAVATAQRAESRNILLSLIKAA